MWKFGFKKYEPLTLTCRVTGQRFVVSPEEQEIYAQFGLPVPQFTPDERFRRLLVFQGERRFFWRECDVSRRRIYSAYPATAPFPVWSRSLWREGEWDPMAYERTPDLTQPVLPQIAEFWNSVPRPSRNCDRATDIPVVECARLVRESFLVFDAYQTKYCQYSVRVDHSSNCFDCYAVSRCTDCYECVNCADCTHLLLSENCEGCSDSRFLSYCKNCKNCLFCSNLENREYCVFNEQVSPEEYELLLRKWSVDAQPLLEQAREEFIEFSSRFPIPHMHADRLDHSSGNYIYRSTGAVECFECENSKDLLRCHGVKDAKNCIDVHRSWGGVKDSVSSISVGEGAEGLLNCIECWNGVKDLAYCSHCEESEHLFGCVGLVGKQYCIFNRQYTKSAYKRLRKEIEQQMRHEESWGQFVPATSSGYAYNQSLAAEFMSLGRVQVEMMGYRWDPVEDLLRPSQLLGGREIAAADRFGEIPERLDDLDLDKVQDMLFLCEMSGRPFTLSQEEVEFYRRERVTPPKRGFEQRHRERLSRMGPRRLTKRPGSAGGEELFTAYPANWRRKVCSFNEWRAMVERFSSR